jgi:hypothetical protein
MCLVSGEVFDSDDTAEEHARKRHNLTLDSALNVNELFVELGEDEDPEKRYKEEVENR